MNRGAKSGRAVLGGALVLLPVVLLLALVEIVLRVLLPNPVLAGRDGSETLFAYDERLGWSGIPNSEGSVRTEARTIAVRHNSLGVRDPEYGAKTRPRLAVLGDSFVWGWEVDTGERFTDLLAGMLPQWEVLNLGQIGYGTDQELVLLESQWSRLEPDAVVLVFCSDNDDADNSWNARYGDLYKPYFVRKGNLLTLEGVPVPRGLRYWYDRCPWLFASRLVGWTARGLFAELYPEFSVPYPTFDIFLALRDFVKRNGATLLVGVEGRSDGLVDFLGRAQIATVLLDNPYRYPTMGLHWTPQGHRVVAERLYRSLTDGGFLR